MAIDIDGRKSTGATRVRSVVAPLLAAAAQTPHRPVAGRIRAWMLLLPVDAALFAAPVLWSEQFKAYLTFSLLALVLLTGGERYRARLHLSVLDELPHLLSRVLVAVGVVATIIALRHDSAGVESFLRNAAIAVGLFVIGRFATTAVVSWSRRRGHTSHPTVLVGGGPLAAELAQKLRQQRGYGLRVVGFVDDADHAVAEAVTPRLGRLCDLDRAVAESGADVVLVADGAFSEAAVHDEVRAPHCAGTDLLIVPRLHLFHTQSARSDRIGSIPVMRIRSPKLLGPSRHVKRAFDVVAVAVTLLVVAPVMAAVALALRTEGPGIIFRQPRVGQDGVVFDCLKFRSMRPVDDAESATRWSIAQDSRVTPMGRFLRRTSLDELPQLLNILRGDMSIVGPRPERPHFVQQFSEQYERYAHRHRVRAGLTGLAQVSGLRGDTSIDDRARFDNYYIENWTLWLDVRVVVRTVAEVAFARGR